MSNEIQEKNLFDELGLSVEYSEIAVGETYPIYGVITKFVDDTPGNLLVTINEYIEATMKVDDVDKIELLKNRCFDPGIFVCIITQKEPTIKVDCTTVIFGKNNNMVQ